MPMPTSEPLRRSRARTLLAAVVAAVLVATLAPAAPAGAQDGSVGISPTKKDNTAVQAGQTVDASGDVGSGELTAARLIGVLADGTQGTQRIDSSVLNSQPNPVTGGDYLRVDAGKLSGRLTLFCLFAAPNDACADRPAGSTADTRQVLLEVVVGGRTLVSPPLRVDYTRPRFRDAFLTGTRTIVARFTEPVRTSDGQPDNPVDWTVTVDGESVPVTAVTGPRENDCVGSYEQGEDDAGPTGCTRTLTLLTAVDEDAVPRVDYVRTESRLPSEGYEDFADNRLFDIGTGARDALDRIRPPVPTITSVDGREHDDRMVGGSTRPALDLSGLRAGHVAFVERIPEDGDAVTGPEVTATADSATVVAPELPADGPHVLRAVVRDPHGNLSTDPTEPAGPPSRSDGGPSQLTYVLDTVAPLLLGAAVDSDSGKVRVTFSEPVQGPDDAGDWVVRDRSGAVRTVTAVEGSGDSRLLTVDGGDLPGGSVAYAAGDGRYADEARNPVADTPDLLIAGLLAPVVTTPSGPLFTNEPSVTVGGRGSPGSTVQVFREGAPGNVLREALIAGDGTWSLEAPLVADERNELRVRAVQAGKPDSPVTAVPRVTQDGTAPVLSLSHPDGGERLTSGSDDRVEWSTSDTNPGAVFARITTDGGKSWSRLGAVPAQGSDGLDYTVPDVDTAAAAVRVVAVDRAGNRTVVMSDPFAIDGLTPTFTARTTTTRTVRVLFSEPVSGPTGTWTVDGRAAVLRSADGSSTPPLTLAGARTAVFETATAFGADAKPVVAYEPSAAGQLEDSSEPGHVIAPKDRVTEALDRIRPAVPSITEVDGQAPNDGRVAGDDPTPSVEASGLLPKNTVWVERLPAGGSPRRGPTTVTTGDTALLQAPELPTQGDHVLRVVAQDPSGNRSTQTAKNAGSEDGSPNPVTYALDSVPRLDVPTITVPDSQLFTAEDSTTVQGTAAPGSTVQLFRDTDGDGDPDGAAVASDRVAGDGTWSATVPLVPDSRNLLLARSVPDDESNTSDHASVPPIVQDGTDPALDLRAPSGGEVLAGGESTTVEWTTSDANPRALLVDVSTDGGSTWDRLGRLSPANGEGEQAFTLPDVDTAEARVRLTAVDRAGNEAVDRSGLFTIDALAPAFTAVTTAPRTITVTFSELVSGPVAPTDWQVDGEPAAVTELDGSGATPATAEGARTLVLRTSADFGEDGTPAVTYAPSPLGELRDRADQGVERRLVTAVDGIRPAVPTVNAVDGRAPEDGRVLGGAVVPQVSVSNLTTGHVVRVERVPATGLPVAGPEVTADGGTALVPAPRLPGDGEHVLRVVVRDPTGNTSLDTAKSSARDDGGPASVVYVLDTDLPAILFAVADNDEITVRFTEPVSPDAGDPADWRVTRADGSPVPLGDGEVTVVQVSGSGDTRVLQATGAAPGDLLVYQPSDRRYVDANANPLPDTTTPLLALFPPVVTTPAQAVVVPETSTVVAGTAQPGSTVSLFRRGDDGRVAGDPVAGSAVADDGTWSLTAPLDADVAHDFLVRSRRTDGRDTIAVPVPTITQDGAPPVLGVTGFPGDQSVHRPGAPFDFQWSVCDANLGSAPMTFEVSLDDGATWSRFGPERRAAVNDCGVGNSLPVTLPGAQATDAARLRVTATDLAGRTTSAVSPRFVLEGPTLVRDVRRFACPPDRVQPAGFTDTTTSTFRFEIDCLAAYAFTKGVTADRYEPFGNVTRAQMALFVARVAGYAGVPLDPSDAGFTDMDGRSQETRDAVNALANLGVVEGVGGGRYAPGEPVSRAQMASFLARVQTHVGEPFTGARDAFDDDAGTTHEANINLIAGAGVVQGTSPGTYAPLASITRQQMAGFLIRYVDGQIEAGQMSSAYE